MRCASLLRRFAAAGAVLFVVTSAVPAMKVDAAPQPLSASISGAEAAIKLPGSTIPCARGGSGSYHSFVERRIPGGVLSRLTGRLRLNLDVHSDGPPRAFLQPEQSHATFTNERGAVQVKLSAGDCAAPTLNFDGTVSSGTGTWAIDPDYTTDAYRQATGNGTFTFTASFGPGRANPWNFNLNGSIEVLQPALTAEVVRAYWGHLGSDYAGRIATVVYRLTNPGPGDAFAARFLTPTTATGILPVEFFPSDLDDLSAGESVDVTVRYKIGLRGPRGGPILVGREFDTTLNVEMPDALDVISTKAVPVHVTAPAFPPPL